MADNRLTFEILWYSGGPDYAPNRCIGRDFIKRYDLSDAITCAANRLKACKTENAKMAQGFYVRVYKGER